MTGANRSAVASLTELSGTEIAGLSADKLPAGGGSAMPCGFVLPAASANQVEAASEPLVRVTALSYCPAKAV